MRFWLVALLLIGPTILPGQTKGNSKRGEALYVEKRVLCHGAHGQGWDWSKRAEKQPIPIPDLTKVVQKKSDQYLFDIINGSGKAVDKTRLMPPFGFQSSHWSLRVTVRSLCFSAMAGVVPLHLQQNRRLSWITSA